MHVLVTGASSGIGEAVARAWAARGAHVTLVARRETELNRVAAALGGPARVEVCDVGVLDGLEALVKRVEAASGPIDVLVNNAGVELVHSTPDVAITDAERLLAVNLLAPLRLTQLVLPGMLARGRGVIVDMCSVAAFSHPPFATYYSASKAGLAAASLSVGDELASRGVHVLTVYPGPIHTEMGRRDLAAYAPSFGQRLLPWGTPEGLAERILRAVDRNRRELVYPAFYGGAKWFPVVARWAIRLSPERLRDGE